MSEYILPALTPSGATWGDRLGPGNLHAPRFPWRERSRIGVGDLEPEAVLDPFLRVMRSIEIKHASDSEAGEFATLVDDWATRVEGEEDPQVVYASLMDDLILGGNPFNGDALRILVKLARNQRQGNLNEPAWQIKVYDSPPLDPARPETYQTTTGVDLARHLALRMCLPDNPDRQAGRWAPLDTAAAELIKGVKTASWGATGRAAWGAVIERAAVLTRAKGLTVTTRYIQSLVPRVFRPHPIDREDWALVKQTWDSGWKGLWKKAQDLVPRIMRDPKRFQREAEDFNTDLVRGAALMDRMDAALVWLPPKSPQHKTLAAYKAQYSAMAAGFYDGATKQDADQHGVQVGELITMIAVAVVALSVAAIAWAIVCGPYLKSFMVSAESAATLTDEHIKAYQEGRTPSLPDIPKPPAGPLDWLPWAVGGGIGLTVIIGGLYVASLWHDSKKKD